VIQTTAVQGPANGELLIQCHSCRTMSGFFSLTVWWITQPLFCLHLQHLTDAPCSEISVVHVSECASDYLAAPVFTTLLMNSKNSVAELVMHASGFHAWACHDLQEHCAFWAIPCAWTHCCIVALEEQVLISFVLIRFWQCIPTADLEDGSPTIVPLVDWDCYWQHQHSR